MAGDAGRLGAAMDRVERRVAAADSRTMSADVADVTLLMGAAVMYRRDVTLLREAVAMAQCGAGDWRAALDDALARTSHLITDTGSGDSAPTASVSSWPCGECDGVESHYRLCSRRSPATGSGGFESGGAS